MSQTGPILLVDDDAEDLDLIVTALQQLQVENEIKTFLYGQELIDYLLVTEDKPLLILCDIRMPLMNGLELRKRLQKDPYLLKKSIPFIFLTAAVSQAIVNDAFEMTVQGFFKKGKAFTELQQHLRFIVDYWKTSLHPNSF